MAASVYEENLSCSRKQELCMRMKEGQQALFETMGRGYGLIGKLEGTPNTLFGLLTSKTAFRLSSYFHACKFQ